MNTIRGSLPTPVAAVEAQFADSTDVLEATRRDRLRLTDNARSLIPIVGAIVGISVWASLASDQFLTLTNVQNVFQQVAVLGILALGAMLLIVAGLFDLSVGAAVALLSIVGAKLLAGGAGEPVVVVVLVLLGAAIGLLIGTVVAATKAQPFILTLGGLSVFAGLALIISNQRPIPVGTAFTGLSLENFGPFPVTGVIFAAAAVIGAAILRFTSIGRSAYAIGSNEEAAYLAGVPIGGTKVVLYAINGVLVGLAAILLLARLGSGDPTAGIGLELQAITAVVLGGASLGGGRGTMLGAFLGVLLLGLISNALTIAGVSNAYEQLVFGGVLIVAVIWAAYGEASRSSNLSPRRRLAEMLGRLRNSSEDGGARDDESHAAKRSG